MLVSFGDRETAFIYILFWKAGNRLKRWLYVNHENQNLFGMTDRETGMGGGCCKMGGPSGNLIRQC